MQQRRLASTYLGVREFGKDKSKTNNYITTYAFTGKTASYHRYIPP
jgi:hypothetical protein